MLTGLRRRIHRLLWQREWIPRRDLDTAILVLFLPTAMTCDEVFSELNRRFGFELHRWRVLRRLRLLERDGLLSTAMVVTPHRWRGEDQRDIVWSLTSAGLLRVTDHRPGPVMRSSRPQDFGYEVDGDEPPEAA